MIYLASPYSHPHDEIREQRYRQVCRAAAALMRNGELVFAPVAHGHALVEFGLPTDWSYWERHCRRQIGQCDELVVLQLAGWEASVGVRAEIRIAGELGKPVRYLAKGSVTPTLASVAQEVKP